MPFNVTNVGSNRKHICDFLLVTLLGKWLFCVFAPPPLGA